LSAAPVSLKHRVEYVLVRAAFLFVAVVPEGLSYRVAGWLGGLFVRFSKRRRRCALRMLHNAYPDVTDDRALLKIARRGTGNLLRVVLDLARASRAIEKGTIADRIDMSEVVALKLPAPWFGITGHLGSWECAAIGVARITKEAHVTARVMNNPLAQRWLRENRALAGLIVHDRRGGVRGVARALENGFVALQAVDQNQRRRGVLMPFFGEPASTERAAAALAVRKGYPFVIAACIRQGVGFRFKVEIEEVLVPVITGDHAADVKDLVRRMNLALEKLILRFPDQYLWIHDRYKTADEMLAKQ